MHTLKASLIGRGQQKANISFSIKILKLMWDENLPTHLVKMGESAGLKNIVIAIKNGVFRKEIKISVSGACNMLLAYVTAVDDFIKANED